MGKNPLKNRMNTLETVAILHAGDACSMNFIAELLKENKYSDNPIYLEYKTFSPGQDIGTLLLIHLEQYRKDDLPLIVVISVQLFEYIWGGSRKDLFLFYITSHVNRYIAHVWVDGVDVNIVRKHSTLLCWKNGPFSSAAWNELVGSKSILKDVMLLLTRQNKLKNPAICVQENDDTIDDQVMSLPSSFSARLFKEANDNVNSLPCIVERDKGTPNHRTVKKRHKNKTSLNVR